MKRAINKWTRDIDASWRQAILGFAALLMASVALAQAPTVTQIRSSKNPSAASDTVQFTVSVQPSQGLNIDFPFAVGASVGTRRFVRYDLTDATFGAPVSGTDFSNNTTPASVTTVAIVQGGLQNDRYVVFEVVFGGASVTPTDVARFSPTGLATSSSAASVTYSLHEFVSSAVGAQPSNSGRLTVSDPKLISAFIPAALTVGTVDLFQNAVPIPGCSALPLTGGSATCSAAFSSIGSYSISALYSGTALPAPGYQTSNATLVQAVGLGVSPTTLPNGSVAQPYALTLVPRGGVAPYSFSLTAGALPPGVNLSAGGTLSGTPTQAGSFSITVRLADFGGITTDLPLTLLVLKGQQTITFSAPANGRVGTAITLGATSTANLPVTFSVLTPGFCTLSGNSLSLTAIGGCVVAASQAGDNNYFAAATVQRTINVSTIGPETLRLRSASGAALIGTLTGNSMVFDSAPDVGTAFLPLAVADLDGNGAKDLVYRNVTSGDLTEVRFWRDSNNNLDTGLRNVRTLWRLETFGDLDGDGKGDLVWRFTGQTANADDTGVSYVWFTDGNGVTQVRKRGGAPLSWTLAGAVDINRDRAADMIYIAPDNSIRVLMATANRTCANFQAGSLLSGYTVMKVGDFTGNRFGELFVRDLSTGQNRIIVLDGTGIALPQAGGDPDNPNASCTSGGQFVPTAVRGFFSADVTFQFFASVDLNGDGILDIIWMKPDRTLQIWLMARDGGIPQVLDNVGPVPAGFSAVAQ